MSLSKLIRSVGLILLPAAIVWFVSDIHPAGFLVFASAFGTLLAAFFASRSAAASAEVVAEMREDRAAALKPVMGLEIGPALLRFDSAGMDLPIPHFNETLSEGPLIVELVNFSDGPAFNLKVKLDIIHSKDSNSQALLTTALKSSEFDFEFKGVSINLKKKSGLNAAIFLSYEYEEEFAHCAKGQRLALKIGPWLIWAMSVELLKGFGQEKKEQLSVPIDVAVLCLDRLGNQHRQIFHSELVPQFLKGGDTPELAATWIPRSVNLN